MIGNSGKIPTNISTEICTITEDFALYDQLPAELRSFFQSSALIWASSDVLYYHSLGLSESGILRALRDMELETLRAERLEVWGPNYPPDLPNPPTPTASRVARKRIKR